jgi:thiamine biosynthesis lipoprotein
LTSPWILVALACVAGEGELHRFQAERPAMGTKFTIVLYAPAAEAAERAFEAAFARIVELNAVFSDYDESSEACRLSRTSGSGQAVAVSGDMWTVLQRSQQIAEATGGAFDVTVGPLTKLWRRARRQHQLPDAERLQQARAAVGWQHVRLDAAQRTVALAVPGMRLDFGGIAKGYAVDEALQKLRALGLCRALVNASGNMAIGDPPPDKNGWKIGIAPLDPQQLPTRFLHLANCGVATSGDGWQFVEIAGRRYSHILDPHTGMGLTQRSSVTLLAPDGMTADGLAKVCVLGPQRGLELIERTPGTACLMVCLEGTQVKTYESKRFAEWDRK